MTRLPSPLCRRPVNRTPISDTAAGRRKPEASVARVDADPGLLRARRSGCYGPFALDPTSSDEVRCRASVDAVEAKAGKGHDVGVATRTAVVAAASRPARSRCARVIDSAPSVDRDQRQTGEDAGVAVAVAAATAANSPTHRRRTRPVISGSSPSGHLPPQLLGAATDPGCTGCATRRRRTTP
jgi:hypothetical protein